MEYNNSGYVEWNVTAGGITNITNGKNGKTKRETERETKTENKMENKM